MSAKHPTATTARRVGFAKSSCFLQQDQPTLSVLSARAPAEDRRTYKSGVSVFDLDTFDRQCKKDIRLNDYKNDEPELDLQIFQQDSGANYSNALTSRKPAFDYHANRLLAKDGEFGAVAGQMLKNRDDLSMFYEEDSPAEGDRFIPMRPESPKQDMLTKVELFTAGKASVEKERRENQLVSEAVDNMPETENKKAYLTLLQKEVLGIENQQLLTELHYDDECRLVNPQSYSQMQKENDPTPRAVDENMSSEQNSMQGNTPASGDLNVYNGAFAFTSPPERLMQSDQNQHATAFAGTAAEAIGDVSSFSTKFSILRFHSDNKSIKSKKSRKSRESGQKRRKISEFDMSTKEKTNQPSGLLDFKVEQEIIGKGIFADARIDGFGSTSNQQVATSRTQSDSSFQQLSKNLPIASDKENPTAANCFDSAQADLDFAFKSSPFQGLSDDGLQQVAASQTENRKISTVPYKVLDAPSLVDDYYLNLVDWSVGNNLAVCLSRNLYIWNAETQQPLRLHDYAEDRDMPAAVQWSRTGKYLAAGTLSGLVQVWDIDSQRLLRTFEGHDGRVGALSWNSQDLLSSGSKDHSILNRDLRVKENSIGRIEAHRQEVCGLKWSFDDRFLASGGNDNRLKIWDAQQTKSGTPLFKFSSHQAAVKAIAWSPHQANLVVSGGGTADRCIKFWNTQVGTELQSVYTGSQVCSLMFSKTSQELVSTHGFKDNSVVVWRYPTMKKMATLSGHSLRVLYLAMSPDGDTVVTGAGDETLRFWKVFPPNKPVQSQMPSALTPMVLR